MLISPHSTVKSKNQKLIVKKPGFCRVSKSVAKMLDRLRKNTSLLDYADGWTSQVKGQAAYTDLCTGFSWPYIQRNQLTWFGWTPLAESIAAPAITARRFAPIKAPATSKTALTGITDCNTIDNKEPKITIRITMGNPTTSRHTDRAKVQIKKLLIAAKE